MDGANLNGDICLARLDKIRKAAKARGKAIALECYDILLGIA